MGKNCPFMHETTALKPTMDGVGMGENCPFMHGKRLLYSIDFLGGGAGKWGERPFCAQGVCVRGGWKGRAGGGGGKGPPVQGSALGKEGRKYGVGMGKNCPFMHGKRRCREVGEKRPQYRIVL